MCPPTRTAPRGGSATDRQIAAAEENQARPGQRHRDERQHHRWRHGGIVGRHRRQVGERRDVQHRLGHLQQRPELTEQDTDQQGRPGERHRPPGQQRTALDLFAAQGYQRTSLRAIADRLGLTKAAILYHFPAKEDLLLALLEPMLSDLEASVSRAARLPWPAARWAAIEGWLDTLLAHRRPLGMLLHDLSAIRHRHTLARMLSIARQAYDLVAGADATRIERVRAVQAIAMLGDPVVFFADVPVDELRAEMLDGVARLLGEVPPGAPAGGGTRPADRPDPPSGTPPTATPALTGAGGRGAPGRRRAAGRPRAMSGEQIRRARALYAAGTHTVPQIAAILGVSRATVYRYLRPAEQPVEPVSETGSDTDSRHF